MLAAFLQVYENAAGADEPEDVAARTLPMTPDIQDKLAEHQQATWCRCCCFFLLTGATYDRHRKDEPKTVNWWAILSRADSQAADGCT